MAAQIADRSNTAMSFSNGESAPELSKLEATRLALAQEQKKRIDAAVARVTGKKEGGKRKGLSSLDTGHLSKKSKTVVDVASDQVDKKNSIARRMVDRFSAMPEPEREEEVDQQNKPTTRSVSTQQFVARSTTVASPLDNALRETTEKMVEEDAPAQAKEEEEEKEEKNDWDGPTTNYHVKQLGLDDKVDIYAPVVQQQHDVQRVRERTKYMPSTSGESINTLKATSDSEADSDFALKDPISQESEESDAVSLPEVDASETQALAEEAEEFERQTAIQTAEIRRTWTKRVFVYTPLFIAAIIVLFFALLFAIDWSQETFQFCEIDAEKAESSEEIFSCSSFVETQSLIKSTLRETVEKVQETVQSYFE
ncbi:uncharacterized protein PITG_03245 [Phytophthora infestans T30-4]|uniref:Transmembrane protein n=1 Tax=Phytophthora infestans (strain T30-4) TaxID=403677 RepID=D0MZR3_PHYIT|nr:uncharacterized protein PITG_03245 [Phytophthora infestans T30-4]EEY65726.1 conserved hypothetical protein [Phytophthora infestans T30-4]|eukprot:XP_002906325.1 conserved hypothetical protein [Phytophthora infestans T30-4]